MLVACRRRRRPPGAASPSSTAKDLTGWKSTGKMAVWSACIAIILRGGGGWLLATREVRRFRPSARIQDAQETQLRRRSPRYNDSRTPPPRHGIQLIDDEGWPGKLESWQHTGSICNVVPAKKINNWPIGEWNKIIVCSGRRVRLNRTVTNAVDANSTSWTTSNAPRPDARGYVGFPEAPAISASSSATSSSGTQQATRPFRPEA
ncbi:MAG: family 16 glycoside hydrolase [Gemmataceae bacterium]